MPNQGRPQKRKTRGRALVQLYSLSDVISDCILNFVSVCRICCVLSPCLTYFVNRVNLAQTEKERFYLVLDHKSSGEGTWLPCPRLRTPMSQIIREEDS